MVVQELYRKPGKKHTVNNIVKSKIFIDRDASKSRISTIIDNILDLKSYEINLLLSVASLFMLQDKDSLSIFIKEDLTNNKTPSYSTEIMGRTYPRQNKIVIGNLKNVEDFAFVFLHELTHYFSFKICKERSFISNIKDFLKFKKACNETLRRLTQINPETLNPPMDKNTFLYIKHILFDRVNHSGYNGSTQKIAEMFAQIPVLILYSKLIPEQKPTIDYIANPLFDFFNKAAIPAMERHILKHTLNRKIAFDEDILKSIPLLKKYEMIEKFQFQNEIENNTLSHFYCENKEKDGDFAKELINDLISYNDRRVNSLLSLISLSTKNNQLHIFLADSTNHGSIFNLFGDKNLKANGLYFRDESTPARILINNKLTIKNNYSKNKVLRTLLHEMTHHAIDKLGIKLDQTFKNIINEIINHSVPSDIIRGMSESDYLKSKQFSSDILNKVRLGMLVYRSKETAYEEFLCDSFKLIQYMDRHPQRKPYIENKFKPILNYIDKKVLPLMDKHVRKTHNRSISHTL